MGKKTTRKKGYEKEKKKNEEPTLLREASHSKNKLPLNAEHGTKLHLEDKDNKESRHEISYNGVEFEASQSEAPMEVDVDVEKRKKKKKKNNHETSGGDVELSTFESGSAINVDVNAVNLKKKKKKNEKRHENGGNDIDLSVRQIGAVTESKVDTDKRTGKNKKLQEANGNAAKCSANQNDVSIEGDVHMDKIKKSKDGHEAAVVKRQTNPKQRDIPKSMIMEKIDQKKKKKRKRDQKADCITKVNNVIDVETGKEREHFNENTTENLDNSRKKKKTKKSCSDDVTDKNHTQKGTPKKVSFSDVVEVFPPADGSTGDLVHGKRFSREEDLMINEAVLNYIETHGLGEEGLNMVLHCRSHPEVKNCWKEIGAVLPWRPHDSVYYRAHVLFERGEIRKWKPEELEFVRKFHGNHGSDWKKLAVALGRHRFHVKDAWRRIKLPNMKKGQWSQEEYQNLFDLVNLDLRLKASEERKTKHGMLRGNIGWEAISEKLATRRHTFCCQKWYDQLTSPLVAEGKWSDVDDYYLVNALFNLDACCMEDVNWDNILENRRGSVCLKRWNQMVKHLDTRRYKSFAEQVEVLSGRYCFDVLGAREEYCSRPAIDEDTN